MRLLNLDEIKGKIDDSITLKKPFVIYRKPNAELINGLFQQDNSINYLTDYSASGFVFAPFNDNKKTIFIPFKKSKFFKCDFNKKIDLENISDINLEIKTDVDSKKNHIDLVKKGIENINKGLFKKVVLSRKEYLKNTEIDLVATFKNLLNLYNNAFVYFWFHPTTGLWLGATPEILLKIENKKFNTIALAGTQPYIKNILPIWDEKEKQEQKYVTDYIIGQLDKTRIEATISNPYTIISGKLAHIRTDIHGVLKDISIENIIKNIHPTPAVCGLPKDKAKSFILNNEGYDREYYTGFLGELNYTSKTNETKVFADFFVNLRCMKIDDKTLSIFIGGGITKDSNSEKEWLETVLKSNTIKNAIKKTEL